MTKLTHGLPVPALARERVPCSAGTVVRTITLRDPKTDFPIATGNSFHTSLSRLSQKEMVDEVVDNILKQRR